MGKQEKLTPLQVDKLISRIRSEYKDFIIRYQKPFTVQNGFELRYLQARQKKIDLEAFLKAEIEVLMELNRREEQRRIKSQQPKVAKKKQSYADKIIEQMEKRISEYPELVFHREASYEMKKLFGALQLFKQKYWDDISYLLRGNTITDTETYFRDIDTPARDMFLEKANEVPALLRIYSRLLSSRPRDWEAIDAEEKRCIIEVAFFLHNTLARLDRIKKNKDSSNENRESIEKVASFIAKMIKDFRLTDLKPQNLGGATYG
jgi:O6-methylguanine-DNA--protein-cysteine methyltransferase